jgi:murein DD-endopeptidase MepM/ murein hydrolase activator NlpD
MAVDGWANLKKVYIDWFDNTQKVVVDWFPNLGNYILDWYANLGKVAKDYFTPIYSFFEDPAAMVFAIIEAYAWGWAEWFLAVLLGGVGLEPPERPKIGTGIAPPFIGKPGPGKIVPGLQWPCNERRISGYRFVPSSHNGLDIGAPLGAPIWSISNGVVSKVVHSNAGYGNRVEIAHDNGAWSLYAHLSAIYVWSGKRVGQGFTIGASGSTGNSSGPHLHIEIKYNGVYVDPAQVLR